MPSHSSSDPDRYRSGRRRSCAHIIGQFLTNGGQPLFEVFLYAFSRFARGNRWIHNTVPLTTLAPILRPLLFPLNGRPIPGWNSLTGSSFTLANVPLLWPIFPTVYSTRNGTWLETCTQLLARSYPMVSAKLLNGLVCASRISTLGETVETMIRVIVYKDPGRILENGQKNYILSNV